MEAKDYTNVKYIEENSPGSIEVILDKSNNLQGDFLRQLIEKQNQLQNVIENAQDVESRREIMFNNLGEINTYLQNTRQQVKKGEIEKSTLQDKINLKKDEVVIELDHLKKVNKNIDFLQDQLSINETSNDIKSNIADRIILESNCIQNQLDILENSNEEIQHNLLRSENETCSVQEQVDDQEITNKENQIKINEFNSHIDLCETNILEQDNQISLIKQNLDCTEEQIKLIKENFQENEELDASNEYSITEKELFKNELLCQLKKHQDDYALTLLRLSEHISLGILLQKLMQEQDEGTFSNEETLKEIEKQQYSCKSSIMELEYVKINNQQIVNEVENKRDHFELEIKKQDLNRNQIHKPLLVNDEEKNIILKLLDVQDSLVETYQCGHENFQIHHKSLIDKIHEYQKRIDIEFENVNESQNNIKSYQNSFDDLKLVHINELQKSSMIDDQISSLKLKINDKETQITKKQDEFVESTTKQKLIEESLENEKQYQIKVLQSSHETELQTKLLNDQLKSYDENIIDSNQNIDQTKQEVEKFNQKHEETIDNISKAKSGRNQSELLVISFQQQFDELNNKQEKFNKNKNDLDQEIKSTGTCITSKTNLIESEKQKQQEITNVTNFSNETLEEYKIHESKTNKKLKDAESILSNINVEIQPVKKYLDTIRKDFNVINKKIEENDEVQTIIHKKLTDKNMQNKELKEFIIEEELEMNNLEQTLIKSEEEKQELKKVMNKQDTECNTIIEKNKEKEDEIRNLEGQIKQYKFDELSIIKKLEQSNLQKTEAQKRLQKVEKHKSSKNVKFQELTEYKKSIEKQCKENNDAYIASQKILEDSEENIKVLDEEIKNNKLKKNAGEKEQCVLNDTINQLKQILQNYETNKDATVSTLKEIDLQGKISQTKLTEQESKLNDYNQNKGQLTNKIEALKNDLKDYEFQKDFIIQKLKELKDENTYNEQIKDNDSLNICLQQQIDDLKTKTMDSTQEHEKVENNLISLQKRMEEEKTKHAIYQEKLRESESKYILIQDTLKELVAKRELVEKNKMEHESNQFTLKEKIKSMESNKKFMEDKLNNHKLQQVSIENKLSDLVKRKYSSYEDLNNHSTIINESKKSIEKNKKDTDSVGEQFKNEEKELKTKQTYLHELNVQKKNILDEIKEIHIGNNLIQMEINIKESNINNLFSKNENEYIDKEKFEQKILQSENQMRKTNSELCELYNQIGNNNIIQKELEENIKYVHQQIDNNEIEQGLTNENLEKLQNEIIKIRDQNTFNEFEENKSKKKLNESENMKSSIHQYIMEINSQLATETTKRTEIDNEISKSQCQQYEIKEKQTAEEKTINQGLHLKRTLEAKLNNVESGLCSNKNKIENLDEKWSDLLLDIKNKESIHKENLQCLKELETERHNLQENLEKEERIKGKAIQLLSQSEKSINILSKEQSEKESQIIEFQEEISQLKIEKDSLLKATKEHDILTDSYKKVLVESESRRELIQHNLDNHEIKQSLALHDLMDSETKRDLLHEQLSKTSLKNKKDQILHEISGQEERRVNAQNQIKELFKNQDKLQKQQTDEEKTHLEIQQHLKEIVENERLSKSNLQSNSIKIEETNKNLNELNVLYENTRLKLFESSSIHELNTKNKVETDLNINSLLNNCKENKEKRKCLQLKLKDCDLESNLIKDDIKENEIQKDSLKIEIDSLGVEKKIIWKEIEEQTIQLSEAQQNILEISESIKFSQIQTDKWAESSVENNIVMTELEEKVDSAQKQIKEGELTKENLQGTINDLHSQKIIFIEKINNCKTNENTEQWNLYELNIKCKSYKETLEEKINNMNTVKQESMFLEENKIKLSNIAKDNTENQNNLIDMLNNSSALENSINDQIKAEKLSISELYKNISGKKSSIKSLNDQLEENTQFQDITNQKLNELETSIKHSSIQLNEKQTVKCLIEQRLSETEEITKQQKEDISDLLNDIDSNNVMNNELVNQIDGLNKDLSIIKSNIDSMQNKYNDSNIIFSEFEKSLKKSKEKENLTKKDLQAIEDIRLSLFDEIKVTVNNLSGLEPEYEKYQEHLKCIQDMKEDNQKILIDKVEEKFNCEIKNKSLIIVNNEQLNNEADLRNNQKEIEELIILTQKKLENKEFQYSDSIRDNEEFQKINISIHDQIKCIIGKKCSLHIELEKIESQIDLLKKEICEKVKVINTNKINLDELTKTDVFLNKQLKELYNICSNESEQLIELKNHDESQQSTIKNKSTECNTIKQALVDLEEERYLIHEDLSKIENLELQEQKILKDCIVQKESFYSQLEQCKLEEIGVQETLKKTKLQKKLSKDPLLILEEKLNKVKEKLKDLSEKNYSNKAKTTILENEILVISQDLVNLDATKLSLTDEANENIIKQNKLEKKVKDFESHIMKYNDLMKDLKNKLTEINLKINSINSFNSIKENIQELEMEIDLYKTKLEELGIQKTSMEQEIMKFEEEKRLLQIKIKDENKWINNINMQLIDYEAQVILIHEKLKEKSNKNNILSQENHNMQKDKAIAQDNILTYKNETKSLHEDQNNINTKIKLLKKNLKDHRNTDTLKNNQFISAQAERDTLVIKLQTHEKELIFVLRNIKDLENQRQDFDILIREQVTELSIQQQKLINYKKLINKLNEQLRTNEIKSLDIKNNLIAAENIRNSYQEQILDNKNQSEKYKNEITSLEENEISIRNQLCNLEKYQVQILNKIKDPELMMHMHCDETYYQEFMKYTETQNSGEDFEIILNKSLTKHIDNAKLLHEQLERIEKNINTIKVEYNEHFNDLLVEKQICLQSFNDRYSLIPELGKHKMQKTVLNHELDYLEKSLKLLVTKKKTFQASKETLAELMQEKKWQEDLLKHTILLNEINKVRNRSQIEINLKKIKLKAHIKEKQTQIYEMDQNEKDLNHFTKPIQNQIEEQEVFKSFIKQRNSDIEKQIISFTEQLNDSEKQISNIYDQRIKLKEKQDEHYQQLQEKLSLLNENYCKQKELNSHRKLILKQNLDNISSHCDHLVKDPEDNYSLENKILVPDLEIQMSESNNEKNNIDIKSHINISRSEIVELEKPFPEDNCDTGNNSDITELSNVCDNHNKSQNCNNSATILTEFDIQKHANEEKSHAITIRDNILEEQIYIPNDYCDKDTSSVICIHSDVIENHSNQSNSATFDTHENSNLDKELNIKQNIQTLETKIKSRYEDLVELQIKQASFQKLDQKQTEDVIEKRNESQKDLRELERKKKILYEELAMKSDSLTSQENVNSESFVDEMNIDLSLLRRRQEKLKKKNENTDAKVDESNKNVSVQLSESPNSFYGLLSFKMRILIVMIIVIFIILSFGTSS